MTHTLRKPEHPENQPNGLATQSSRGSVGAVGIATRPGGRPQPDLKEGVNAMQKLRVSGTVKNMSGTKRISVKKPK